MLLVGADAAAGHRDADLDLAGRWPPPSFEIPPTGPETMALLHFTSGTTGKPKGGVHVHEAVVAHHVTAGYALDLRPTTCSGAPPTRAG